MKHISWLKRLLDAEADPHIANKLSENKHFKKLILSFYSIPQKLMDKIEDHVDPTHKPSSHPKILLPEAEKTEKNPETKESKTN